MFSGIVEAVGAIKNVQKNGNNLRIVVDRPTTFVDIRGGDSIATNGVCLTVEEFTTDSMTFSLGEETLKVTGWNESFLREVPVNMERSLRMGDRMHGHWVSGHVDTVGTITRKDIGESVLLDVNVPELDRRYVWHKGCVAINGVSLTINAVNGNTLSFCLVPETMERTNFKNLSINSAVNIEYDYWAKAFVNYQEAREKTI